MLRDVLGESSAKEKEEEKPGYVGIITGCWCLANTYDREEGKKKKS